MKTYDAIVIGSGQAGTPLSKRLAMEGLKTALIEKRWVGGTCVNDGCSPTKAMIASARAAWVAANSQKIGVYADNVRIDIKAVFKHKNDIVKMMRDSSEKGIKKTRNLDLIYGTAVFTGKKEISVTDEDGNVSHLKADKIFINTGASPEIPEIEGIDQVNYLTSTTILELPEIPEHLLIIGSGYIGLEFGQMYRRFGSKISIVSHAAQLLSKEDPDISAEMSKILEQENIRIFLKATVSSLAKTQSGISAKVDVGGKRETIACTHVLIAAGRMPNSGILSLDKTGVKTDENGFIVVNSRLETSAKGIYALGDVKPGPAFTHISYDDFRIIRTNLLEKGRATITNRQVPYCMFTDPQLGRIGITEQQAKEQGIDVLVAVLSNSSIARCIETGDERGMMKAVVDARTGKILGAAVLAEQGGEVVSVLQMAIKGGITYQEIRDGIFAHPTYSESLNNLFMTLDK
ncbi:mercuric reductase [Dyadobacter sp. CY312]|uniref:mercuric reductase n=1 Tax=Dyadobacter sp. CY312 TaxID=2907303 RepID=UPI001F342AE7|nr:mercuric reductase [Dyadobacter sp. CY312]MCE7038758.1 mercuric reductase [Dyadobacter sp. CY312]